MKRTLVVGDIHGGLRALNQVFATAEVSPDDTLIFLGDYVDGWSESAQVIDYLIELSATNSCIFIKGNHDIWCEKWLRTQEIHESWYVHGGKETMESYHNHTDEDKILHLNFLESMPYYYIDDSNRLFIHAGFTSMHGPQKEFHDSNFSWDRTLWETALAMDKHLQKHSELFPKRLLLFSEIYIGHTPTLNYNISTPMNKANVWNVDTGAAFYGKLSVMDIDTKKYWQSEGLPSLYPNEKGRNKSKN